MNKQLKTLAMCTATTLSSTLAHAIPVGYDIGWTGANNYTMTGSFSYDDALLGTGNITSS